MEQLRKPNGAQLEKKHGSHGREWSVEFSALLIALLSLNDDIKLTLLGGVNSQYKITVLVLCPLGKGQQPVLYVSSL